MKPRFLADCNVGRLARWLRALGYDASYHARIGDAELVREAAAESRVLLTRDRDLTKRRVIQTANTLSSDERTRSNRRSASAWYCKETWRMCIRQILGRPRSKLARIVHA